MESGRGHGTAIACHADDGAGTADVARGRASLPTVDPTIRPPSQPVRDRVRVFEPEAGEAHLGITVRPGVDFSSLEQVLVVMVPPTGAAHAEDAK